MRTALAADRRNEDDMSGHEVLDSVRAITWFPAAPAKEA
jgi:hypothetical protein